MRGRGIIIPYEFIQIGCGMRKHVLITQEASESLITLQSVASFGNSRWRSDTLERTLLLTT